MVVGGTAISGGRGTIAGTLLGVMLLGSIGPALTFLGSARIGRRPSRADYSGGGAMDAVRVALGETCRHRCAERSVGRGASAASPTASGCWLLALAVEIGDLRRRSAQNFFTRANAFEVVRLSVELGLLAVALTPVIVTGGIDLSVGSLMGLSAVVFGELWRDGGCRFRRRPALALAAGLRWQAR